MTDLIEALRGDAYSLPSQGAWIERDGSTLPNNSCAQAADEIERLRAELESLRSAAVRYWFLRDDFSPIGVNIDGNHAWAYRRNATLKGPNLDAAIDAAMTGETR